MAENKNVYINSFEASDIYEHQMGKPISKNTVGMMPFSLDIKKFKKIGGKIFTDRKDKKITHDVINVKFNTKVIGSEKLLERFSIEDAEDRLFKLGEKSNNLSTKTEQKKNDYAIAEQFKFMTYLKNAEDFGWDSASVDELRDIIYENGFTYNGVEYVVFKRTGSKSRTGQCQFIKRSLKDRMQRWSRMGMNLDGLSLKDGVDFPSLLAYESLVSSGIVDTVTIHPDNILVVTDVLSKFKVDANIIKKGDDGFLDSVTVKDYDMESDIFDGENLLDEMYFTNGKGSMLLRQHMFKSCAYNTCIQRFLKDNCPDGIEYEEWMLEDMFGNKMYAKDVHMITTPNSLKSLKFYKRKKTKKLMFEHWKKKVIEDGCEFGICKYEKKTKRGFNEDGKPLNRLSYQMINSLDIDMQEIETLAEYELEYISKLKDDDSEYVKYLQESINEMNSNEMLVDLYNHNPDIVGTQLFKNKRKSDISGYTRELKKGKIRTVGDYCTICQNPKELIYHAIGKIPIDENGFIEEDRWKSEMEISGNECFTSLHDFGRDYVAFRSPHTSPSNVLITRNVKSKFIEKYMNYTDNIIYINAIGFEVNRILSGSDVDGDTLVIFDNEELLKVARRCYKQYPVCENGVEATKVDYAVNERNMAKIDNILSTSQANIGEVVNLGQACMSAYWEEVVNYGDTDRAKDLLKAVDICTVLSEIAIDMAKKMYDIDFKKEIKNIKRILNNDEKPMFFKYVSKNQKTKLRYYDTPMDYLYKVSEEIPKAKYTNSTPLHRVMRKGDFKVTKKSKKQHDKFHDIIEEYINSRRGIYAKYPDKLTAHDEDLKKERFNALDDIVYKCSQSMGKYKLIDSTIYYVIEQLHNEKLRTKEILTYMNVIYRINKDTFLSVFKKKTNEN